MGAVLRYGAGIAFTRLLSNGGAAVLAFPWPTLMINVIGSALMGVVFGWLQARGDVDGTATMRLLLATGILGGFTTFSAFSAEAGTLLLRGQTGAFALYAALSVIACIGAFLLGFAPFLMRGASI